MAFTKITNAGFGLTTGTLVGVAASFSSTVSVGGTLTYEDVTNVDSVGLITARNGIEVTDKGVQVGTGATVDSAADNTLTFLTGGSERVRVTSTGDVGVNCTPHSNAGINLHIHGDNTSSEIRLTNTTTGSGANGSILQQSGNTLYLSNTENGNTVFEVNGSERLRIDSSGRMGLGTSSIDTNAKLDVDAGSLPVVANFDTTAVGGGAAYFKHDGANKLIIGTAGSSALSGSSVNDGLIRTESNLIIATGGNTERLRIDSSGRLLLNTTTEGPSTADDLTIATSGNTGISIRSGTSSAGNIFFSDGTSGDDEIRGVIQYDHASNYMRLYTNATERMRVDEAGRLLINHTADTAPNSYLSKIQLCDTSYQGSSLSIRRDGDTSSGPVLLFAKSRSTSKGGSTVVQNNDAIGSLYFYAADGTDADTLAGEIGVQVDGTPGGNNIPSRMVFATNSGSSDRTERMRIDSAGRLLVNHSSNTAPDGFESKIQTVGTDYRGGSLSIRRDGSNASGPALLLTKSRSSSVGGNTIVQDGDTLGSVWFYGADGNDVNQGGAKIECQVDDTPGSNDMPGRLVFATTSNDTASPSERMRITNGGYLKTSDSANYYNAGAYYHESNQSRGAQNMIFRSTNASYGATQVQFGVSRAATSAYWFVQGLSSYDGSADTEFYIRGDGNAFADGTWNGGGADYAEYFEWSDGNTEAEDRRGISVVLDGDKIREAVTGEEPIGVISGNPSVVGDADVDRWKGKYLHDDYGSYVLDEDGYRQLNPDYDSSVEYVQREDRPEWDTVGLMGKLRIRKGQVTGTRWIKMRDVSNTVEEWLIR